MDPASAGQPHFLIFPVESYIFVIAELHVMNKRAINIREHLNRELVAERAFWSYDIPDSGLFPDEFIIEKTLISLDIEDINKLFLIFPKRKIKKIWNEKLIINDEQFHSMNLLFAHLYFNIKNPERYLKSCLNKHYRALYHI
jgi:hypothetical protein